MRGIKIQLPCKICAILISRIFFCFGFRKITHFFGLLFICQFIPPFYDFRIVELDPLFKRWAEPRILNIIAITARFLNHSIMCKISDGSTTTASIISSVIHDWFTSCIRMSNPIALFVPSKILPELFDFSRITILHE